MNFQKIQMIINFISIFDLNFYALLFSDNENINRLMLLVTQLLMLIQLSCRLNNYVPSF
jgi:hypothetical protein